TKGSSWIAYNSFNGEWVYTIENVPRGVQTTGPNGEILIYTVDSDGWMTLWNSYDVINNEGTWVPGRYWNPGGKTLDASLGIVWNKTIPEGLQRAYQCKFGDRIVGSSTSTSQITTWGISLKPGQEGTLLFKETWQPPTSWVTGNQSISRAAGSIEDGLITVWNKETQQYWGFSTETGKYLWGPTEPQNYLDFLGLHSYIAYGRFFSQGMSGMVYCYNATTGKLIWTYSADDPYNQVLWANQWHIRPLFFADGKIYMGTSEHSPVDPKTRGSPFVCVDVENGDEIWRANGLFRQSDWGGRAI
ncbi:unnamed protein product, partial [marine sediment metagenome]